MESIKINTCRTCLTVTEPSELKSMFRDGEFLGERIKLSDILQQLIPITINENDPLPSQMCKKCILILFRSYIFHKNCLKSDETLKKLLCTEKVNPSSPQFCITETDDNTLYFCDQPNINEKILDTTKLCEESLLKFESCSPLSPAASITSTTELTKLNQTNFTKEIVISNYQPIELNNEKIRYAIFYENTGLKFHEKKSPNEIFSKKLKIDSNLIANTNISAENYVTDMICKDDSENIILDENCEFLYRNLSQQREKLYDDDDENIQFKDVEYIDVQQDMNSVKMERAADQSTEQNDKFESNLIDHEKSDDLIDNDNEYFTYENLHELKSNLMESKKNILKQFICHICNKILATSNSYKYHMQLHSDDKPFLCNECGEAFKTRNAYMGHVITHDKNNPNKCKICGKIYRQASSLKNHLESFHNGKKPFACSECGKGFTQNSGYKKHLLVHTGEKPHVCSICGKSFRYSSNLIAHKRGHTTIKENRFGQKQICLLCTPNRIFHAASSLKKHMSSIHQIIKLEKNDGKQFSVKLSNLKLNLN